MPLFPRQAMKLYTVRVTFSDVFQLPGYVLKGKSSPLKLVIKEKVIQVQRMVTDLMSDP